MWKMMLLVFLAGGPAYSGEFAGVLAPLHTVDILHTATRGLSPDKWNNGYLPMFESTRVPGSPVTVWMYNRDGEEVIRRTDILPSGVYQIVPYQAAATPDGKLVLSADVWSSAAEAAPVLCFVSPPGVLEKVVRTESVAADSLAIDDGGTMWGFGSPPALRFERRATYNTLERWDRQGRTVSTFVPRSVFSTDLNPVMCSNGGESRVLASRNRLALYSALTKEWLELDRTSGEIIERYVLEPPVTETGSGGPVSVTDIVITSSDRVYANFCGARGAGSSLFQLDRRQRRWIPIPSTFFPPGFAGLYGAEGDELILRTGPGLYGWFRLPDLTGGELRQVSAVSR